MHVAIFGAFVLSTFAFAAAPQAQNLSAALSGKICRGTFAVSDGCKAEKCRGAFRLVFKGGTVEMYSAFGPEAFVKAFGDSVSLSPTGVTSVRYEGSLVRIGTADLADISLTYQNGRLDGYVDPRRNPERRNWTTAKVRMTCN